MTTRTTEATPIACVLSPGDFRARLAWIAEINQTALRDHCRDGLRLELVYTSEAREQVREMVRREQRCCAFLAFNVRDEPGCVRVTIEAPEAARDAAETLFKAFRSRMPAEAGLPERQRMSKPMTDTANPTRSAPDLTQTSRVVGATVAIAAAGAMACGVCCVLPFALPTAALAVTGGVLARFAGNQAWMTAMALAAVAGGWLWVGAQALRTKRRPTRSTLRTMIGATLMACAGLAAH